MQRVCAQSSRALSAAPVLACRASALLSTSVATGSSSPGSLTASRAQKSNAPNKERPHLFSRLRMRAVTLPNRIGMAPMNMFAADNGLPTVFHHTHYISRAVGGVGVSSVVLAISPTARLSVGCLGLWSEEHVQALRPLTAALSQFGAVPLAQLDHAGRKGSLAKPWDLFSDARPQLHPHQHAATGAWHCVAPSALSYGPNHAVPRALADDEIPAIVEQFAEAARRAVRAGFRMVELHAAHGHLLHQFLSPISNVRPAPWGGSLDNRLRLLREVVAAVRNALPEYVPLSVRLAASDLEKGGWDMPDALHAVRTLAPLGVDLFSITAGSLLGTTQYDARPLWLVPLAARVKRETGVLTAACGLITRVEEANTIVRDGQADVVMLGRVLVGEPYWANFAARALNQWERWPPSYREIMRQSRMGDKPTPGPHT